MPVERALGNPIFNVRTLDTVGGKADLKETPLSLSNSKLNTARRTWQQRKGAAEDASSAAISKLVKARGGNGAQVHVSGFVDRRKPFARAFASLLNRLLPSRRAEVAPPPDLKTAHLRMTNLKLFEQYLPEMHSSTKPAKLARTLSGLPSNMLSRANPALKEDVLVAANNKLLSFRKRDGFKNSGDRVLMRQLVASTLILEGYEAAAKLKQDLGKANAKAKADGKGADFSDVLKSSLKRVHSGTNPSAALAADLKNFDRVNAQVLTIAQEREYYADQTQTLIRHQHPERPETGHADVPRTRAPAAGARWKPEASPPSVLHPQKKVRDIAKLAHKAGAMTGPEVEHLVKNLGNSVSRANWGKYSRSQVASFMRSVSSLMQLPAFRQTGADSDQARLNNLRGLLYVAALHDKAGATNGNLQKLADKLCTLPAEDIDNLVKVLEANESIKGDDVIRLLENAPLPDDVVNNALVKDAPA